MKTSRLFGLAVMFALGAFAMYAYQKYFQEKPVEPPTPPTTTYRPPTMNSELIRGMVTNYRDNQLAVINKTLQLNDAHAISFKLEDLKNFIGSIEQESKKVKPELSDKDLGVRMYYAAYPINDRMKGMGVSEDYGKRHTLVMIPTLKRTINGNTLDYDFNPLDPASYDATDPYMRRKQFFQPNKSGTSVMALNHGSLTPPDDPRSATYP